MPTLLREARSAYRLAIRRALRSHGLDALPEHSAYLLGGLRLGVPYDALVVHRRHALARAGTIEVLADEQLIRPDGEGYALTPRGREVSEACAAASASLEAEVAGSIGPDGLAALRAGLVAIIDWRERQEGA
jgi:hypothetical protein